VLVYCGSQQAGAFVDLNQPWKEAAALHPPLGAWLEVTSGCARLPAVDAKPLPLPEAGSNQQRLQPSGNHSILTRDWVQMI